MKSGRTWLIAFGLLFSSVAPALALPAGTLAITEEAMDPHSKSLDKDLKKAQVVDLAKKGDVWHVYFVAYLKKAAGAEEVNLVFYELAKGKREQVNVFPINTKPDAQIIASDVTFGPENGFKPGAKYDVLVTRLVGGKEDVYARTKLQLK